MDLITLHRNDGNFFCPLSGSAVFNDDGEPQCPTFRGLWCDAEPSEVIEADPELGAHWQAFLARTKDEQMVDVVGFLRSLQRPGWVAFEVNSYGFACGPVWSTTWTVLDLSGKV